MSLFGNEDRAAERLSRHIRPAEPEYTYVPQRLPGGYTTKTSGERVDFEGGGHRDAEAGKPRFDLLRPLNVPHSQQLLTRWAALMGRGAEHYGDRNWERMNDAKALDRFRSSAARHFEQWLTGERDEDHAVATFFNIQGAEYVRGAIDGLWLPLGAA